MKHPVEIQKMKVEVELMKHQMYWEPFKYGLMVATAIITATATITALIIKLM